jgi:hypothetical protein
MTNTLPVMGSLWADDGKDSSNLKFAAFSGLLDETVTKLKNKTVAKKQTQTEMCVLRRIDSSH